MSDSEIDYFVEENGPNITITLPGQFWRNFRTHVGESRRFKPEFSKSLSNTGRELVERLDAWEEWIAEIELLETAAVPGLVPNMCSVRLTLQDGVQAAQTIRHTEFTVLDCLLASALSVVPAEDRMRLHRIDLKEGRRV